MCIHTSYSVHGKERNTGGEIKREKKRGGETKTETEVAERHCCAACVNVCSNSVMTVCALFCLYVYNESSVIGQVDVVSDGGRGNTLQ